MSDRHPRITRRGFIGAVGAAAGGAAFAGDGPASAQDGGSQGDGLMQGPTDGPASPHFTPIELAGDRDLSSLAEADVTGAIKDNLDHAPQGNCVCWGIPFRVDRVALVKDETTEMRWEPVAAPWLVFMHTADVQWLPRNEQGFFDASQGVGLLRQRAADYVLLYEDGSEERASILRRHHLGMVRRGWGENCFESVAHIKPHPQRTLSEQPRDWAMWGGTQTRVVQPDGPPWVNWLWAWENPDPGKRVVGVRVEPGEATVVLSAVTAGRVSTIPLRWERRQKAVLYLPEGESFDPNLDRDGLSPHLQLDLGQVISLQKRTAYPDDGWEDGYNNQHPAIEDRQILVEYTAHPDATFHLKDGSRIPVADLNGADRLRPVRPATERVKLHVIDAETRQPVAVKLHVHGEAGEYLAPVDRHRIPNRYWFEDYSVDYINPAMHYCTYIPGETVIDLPAGKVFVEISKGFEVRPVRKALDVAEGTSEITITLEKVLPWRERGWITADTHVHFLTPQSAHLEGAGEGVNVVNLLASQWGELMTNVGDFDGRTTVGSTEAGGDGEYLVRVGTENRQHVLGHISLLGYNGGIIAPMCSGGPDEAALGDPVDVLLTEWARQCRKQGGVVILPHFPNPRAEHAAAIISGDIDGIEMTSWMNLYAGIDPYALSDWYRYLNCGYFVPAVGGTDKMQAETAVGAIRTYAKLTEGAELSYDAWKDAIRSGQTFVTYGPLMDFAVEGKPPGQRIAMGAGGGTVDVTWSLASVTVPMSRVELMVNGEIRESLEVDPWSAEGSWSVPVERSSWIALLVRGHYEDKPEIIAAHSSPVMVDVEGSEFFAAADAVTILDQIEGALAYLDTIGTRAETKAYRRMRMVLTGAYRSLHNRMHQRGDYHEHTHATDHPEHH
ncbi:MAG: hypothetical protein GF320_21780 [Armatimonadia bacterium]|nr:hypothetical protein [Armatimonadia bacterium]